MIPIERWLPPVYSVGICTSARHTSSCTSASARVSTNRSSGTKGRPKIPFSGTQTFVSELRAPVHHGRGTTALRGLDGTFAPAMDVEDIDIKPLYVITFGITTTLVMLILLMVAQRRLVGDLTSGNSARRLLGVGQ